MRQNYVVGFAFSSDRSKVVLIKKKRPAWQAGKLNGIGGKVDPGENIDDAMCREFFEECGVQTLPQDWHYYMKLLGRDGDVFLYRLLDDKALAAKTCLDEEVIIMDMKFDEIKQHALTNLVWLLGIALDDAQPSFFVEANYNQDFTTGKRHAANG